jgi:hypothetical protein
MTPEEIEKHFGIEALDMLYDILLDCPQHELADWILSYHKKKEVSKWIAELRADREEEDDD